MFDVHGDAGSAEAATQPGVPAAGADLAAATPDDAASATAEGIASATAEGIASATAEDIASATAEDIARWEAGFGYPDPHPSLHLDERTAELMSAMPPGAELAAVLDQADLSTADDAALVEVVAAWHRLGAWVTAQTARAAAALSDRDSMNPDWPTAASGVTCTDTTGEELAIRLGCSRRQARLLVRDGRAFAGHLAPSGDALADGHIDPIKARVLVEALRDVPVQLALDVQEAVLPGADRRTPRQLGADIERQLIAADPGEARSRHDAACAGRRVNAPRPLPNGMAGLWAVLPAAGAVQLDTTLDALARSARSGGDPRTLDQLRADLLIDLTVGTAAGGTATTGTDGVGVAGPDANEAATQPGAPAAGSDLAAATSDANRPARHLPRRARIQVVVNLTTLAGLDEHPAELVGYGPVTADTARVLARGGTWQRILTDPVSGTVLDVGRTRYRPPADLADHVCTRDRTCSRPGCSTPAERCDLDHTGEYHQLGTTSHDNLGPLCRRDHMIKTHGGFQLSQPEPGVFRWTTPTGHRYTVIPGRSAPYQHQRPAPDRVPGADATDRDPPPY